MPLRRKRILFLAADGARARFFEGARIGGPLKELRAREMRAAPLAPSRARPARGHDRLGPARHAIEPRQTPRAAAEARFARTVAQATERLAARYDELVICAAPVFLGQLREHLAEAVAAKVKMEVPKDYVGQDGPALSAALAKIALAI